MSISILQIHAIDYSKLKPLKVSVALTTFRKDPKFQLMFESLSRQTHKNFEFVIADYRYSEHKKIVEDFAKLYNIHTIHVPREFPGASYAVNTSIIHSSGDYFIQFEDCTYVPHNWIEKHLLVASNNFLSLGARYFTYGIDFPLEKYILAYISIPKIKDEYIQNFIKEKSGIEDYLFLNFGEHIVESPQDFRLINIPENYLLEDNILMEALPGWSYGGNVCMPIEMALSINGWDEAFDKGYGHPDCNFGVRLYNKGYKSYLNISNWILQVQDSSHESVFTFLPELDTKEKKDHNWDLYEAACIAGTTWVNSHRNLREERKKILEDKK